MPLDSLPAEFLFRMQAALPPPVMIQPGPQGDRMIFGVASGSFEGPRLRGEVVPGPGSEWATRRSDGSLRVDVRLVLKTEDDAHILMTYNGVGVAHESGLRVTTAPTFQTGDERYSWLNNLQAVGIGAPEGSGIAYDVYQLGWPG